MSAALAAHGLHYGLVGGGLVVVVALLRGGRVRRTRAAAAEHDRRVAELREAARTGRLGERRLDDDRA